MARVTISVVRATCFVAACRPVPSEQAFRAVTGWPRRAQREGRLAKCDVETLASTILGALHGWAFTARVCGQSTTLVIVTSSASFDLLWDGIGGGRQ